MPPVYSSDIIRSWSSFGPGSSPMIKGSTPVEVWNVAPVKNGSLSKEQKLCKFASRQPLNPHLGIIWTASLMIIPHL